jgi:hypothetical protein
MIRVAHIGSVISMVLLCGLVARAIARVGIDEGYSPAQPLAFSHRIHAGEARVPCLYCHSAATTSRHAGIPPANVCMNCHTLLTRQTRELQKLREAVQQQRPMQWIKVHNLPDFVHFNHSRHVAGGGVTCQQCHGDVAEMDQMRQAAPLTMGWCLDCHSARGVTTTTGNTDCARCHH